MIKNKKIYSIILLLLFSIILGVVVINLNESQIIPSDSPRILPNDIPSDSQIITSNEPQYTVSDLSPYGNPTVSYYLNHSLTQHVMPIDTGIEYFDLFFTVNDVNRLKSNLVTPIDGAKINFNDSNLELLESLKPNPSTIVIYPLFTSAAYTEPGFYTFYEGKCDESCITDLSFSSPEFLFTSSGLATQLLYSLGYEFVTDVDVDKNPELLNNFETVILLHNEYVTQNIFDAVVAHPNIIFLFPNALYAEIDVNYTDETITLIRGHNYPEESIANGFDYEIEERFHEYEYDIECLDWKFIKFDNGYALNCYPDGVLPLNLDILIKMKELT